MDWQQKLKQVCTNFFGFCFVSRHLSPIKKSESFQVAPNITDYILILITFHCYSQMPTDDVGVEVEVGGGCLYKCTYISLYCIWLYILRILIWGGFFKILNMYKIPSVLLESIFSAWPRKRLMHQSLNPDLLVFSISLDRNF